MTKEVDVIDTASQRLVLPGTREMIGGREKDWEEGDDEEVDDHGGGEDGW